MFYFVFYMYETFAVEFYLIRGDSLAGLLLLSSTEALLEAKFFLFHHRQSEFCALISIMATMIPVKLESQKIKVIYYDWV